MASVLSRFRSLFERRSNPLITGPYLKGVIQPVPDIVGITNPLDSFSASSTNLKQNAKETDRLARYATFETMDVGDVESVLDVIVDAALTFEDEPGITFKLEGKSRSVQAINDFCNYVNLHEKLPLIIRDMVKYGDSFVELLDDGNSITRVQTYDPTAMFVNMDNKGIIDPTRSYVQYSVTGQETATWSVDQIAHFMFQFSDRTAYSPRSFLDSIVPAWQNLTQMEQGLVLARVTRAYTRLLHTIDTTNKTTADARKSLASYIRATTRQDVTTSVDLSTLQPITRTDLAVNEDYYVTSGYVQGQNGTLEVKRNDIKMLDPSIAGLGQLADVEYARRKLFSRIPPDVIGIPSEHVDLTNQHIAYARLLKKIQKSAERTLRFIFLQELLMQGLAIDDLNIIWPVIETGQSYRYMEGKYRQSLTHQVDIESDLYPRKWILMHDMGHTEDEANEIITMMLQEKKDFGTMTPTSVASQIGQGAKSSDTATTVGPTKGPDAQQNSNNQKTATSTQ